MLFVRVLSDPHGSLIENIIISSTPYSVPLTPHFTCDSNCFISIVEISRGAVSPLTTTEPWVYSSLNNPFARYLISSRFSLRKVRLVVFPEEVNASLNRWNYRNFPRTRLYKRYLAPINWSPFSSFKYC